MWIEILLLSKLAVEPMHGYELRKAVEASTGHTLSNNSLYPTLRRFVDAGAVSRSAEEQEAKPPRHVYTITEVGRELLHDLLADFPADLALNEPEFLARVGNFAWLRPHERARVLEIRRTALTAEQARLTGLAAGQADQWSRAALHHVLGKFDAELRWLAELTTDPREDA
ncbi:MULTISPECIES: PadR family transcriptional regulator [unclassified Amycolatopsis]|uniref:PadR family transcriptional regulator n=1 Tax=unclassified Amycolatopsis TaxID=2618356 RepID=UPI00287578B0|nr:MULTISPECIES: PadR family transcriptional regulator [unclassified Amycolatopsis]MDS0135426.1 PadR family transcriptional regulator [Amycolatopsis sp. 505]MDS0140883.1 PadR family transcriptional regulator [Amycolatopsis sp. CM201R]